MLSDEWPPLRCGEPCTTPWCEGRGQRRGREVYVMSISYILYSYKSYLLSLSGLISDSWEIHSIFKLCFHLTLCGNERKMFSSDWISTEFNGSWPDNPNSLEEGKMAVQDKSLQKQIMLCFLFPSQTIIKADCCSEALLQKRVCGSTSVPSCGHASSLPVAHLVNLRSLEWSRFAQMINALGQI